MGGNEEGGFVTRDTSALPISSFGVMEAAVLKGGEVDLSSWIRHGKRDKFKVEEEFDEKEWRRTKDG